MGVRGQVVHNRKSRMEEIVCSVFPELTSTIGDKRIGLPGVPGTYPNPLQLYPQVLDKKLQDCRKSYVHGDLHLRNVLVDELGISRLIDFAKVGERHNLFDFIKLESYVRLMGLASTGPAFTLLDYVEFEKALAAKTINEEALPIRNQQLLFAQQIILNIRRIARHYMAPPWNFEDEYLPALFLYCLAVLKYSQPPFTTRLAFATACVLGCSLGFEQEHLL